MYQLEGYVSTAASIYDNVILQNQNARRLIVSFVEVVQHKII